MLIPMTLRHHVTVAMMLDRLPPELARLVRSCMALHDAVALAACALPAFLPTVEELDAYVLESARRLRSDARRSPGRARRHGTQCREHGCPYHQESLRCLLLNEDTYAQLARRKLDATEALEHLGADVAAAQTVAIDILMSQARRRQLNRFALSRTLEHALYHRYDTVIHWILHSEVAGVRVVPSSWLVKIVLAALAYDTRVAQIAIQEAHKRSIMTQTESVIVLVKAVRHGCTPVVTEMLQSIRYDDAETLRRSIAEAAGAGRVYILRLLLQHSPIDIDLMDAIAHACSHGHCNILHELLSSNHKIGPPCTASPLFASASSGDIQIVQLVLSDIRTNQWDPRALMKAASDGSLGVAQLLVQHPLCQSKDIVEALRCALRSKHPSLLPLAQLFFHRLEECVIDDMLAWELVDLACSNGERDVFEFVHERTQPHKDNRDYWRPLVTAARAGHTHIVRSLLDARSLEPTRNLQPIDEDIEVAEALLAASHGDNLTIVQMLLPFVSIDLIQLLRIVEAAAAAESSKVLDWLIDQGCSSWCDVDAALHYACAHGRTHSVKVLLTRGGARSSDGVALQFAAASGRSDLVELLLEENEVGLPSTLEAALVDAAREGHTLVVARLLADSRLRISSGDAFHEAAQHGHANVLRMLLDYSSEHHHLESMDLHVAFLRASQRGHYETVFVLLNDSRVRLPNGGAIRYVSELPRRPGDTAWCQFLRRFFRHPRIDPTAENYQLLVDAISQEKLGVVDALMRSRRIHLTASEAEAVALRLRSVAEGQNLRNPHRLSALITNLYMQLTS